jgi:murein DD-endopeptidase MepM/ murein hydrolase activator NlpD
MIRNFSSKHSKVFTIYSLIAFLVLLFSLSYITVLQYFTPDLTVEGETTNAAVLTDNFTSTQGAEAAFNPLREIEVAEGHTFIKILRNHDLRSSDIDKIINALASLYDPTKLAIGQKITFHYDTDAVAEPKVQSMIINIAPDRNIEINRTSKNEFVATDIIIPLKKHLTRSSGSIQTNFIDAAINIGVPYNSLIEVIKALSYEVDFQRDIKSGNEIDIVYERFHHKNGDVAYDGDIAFASLQLDDRKLNIYRYTNEGGEVDYLTDDGRSVKKELLRTPVNVAKISSNYGMRKHPIKGYSIMHKGIDFAASIGTPIFAAGNGVIVEMGHKGTYGKYVKIKHNNQVSTAYAHASKFAKGKLSLMLAPRVNLLDLTCITRPLLTMSK